MFYSSSMNISGLIVRRVVIGPQQAVRARPPTKHHQSSFRMTLGKHGLLQEG